MVTVYSQGVNRSESGTDTVNAILNCHLATGRIGRPGMGPFSVTGQPNAMGGREVGGMANMLACHLNLENAGHRKAVQTFWNAPAMPDGPGLKAVDMFRAVEQGHIKALWIICTNPAVSMPEATRVAAAIAACEFVVVSDIMADTDTARLAHVLLPATGWGEKDGTVTNSERRISRQRQALPAPGQARDDWRILAQVAGRMGWDEAFGWETAAQVFDEYARLSGVAGAHGSDFDISNRAGRMDDYAAMEPFLWPDGPAKQGGRFFADGRFHTPDGRARMQAITPRAPQTLDANHPFRLNTGRVRDHWHTMTRTGLSPRLSAHLAEPFLEVHPVDAARLGLHPAALASVTSPHGTAILRTLITKRVAQGQVVAPMHWTGQTAPSGRINALVPTRTDPISGQPASKSAPVQNAPFAARWYGFAVSDSAFRPTSDYWAIAPAGTGNRAELAGSDIPDNWPEYTRALFNLPKADVQTVADRKRGLHRVALSQDGILRAALFIAPDPVALSRGAVAAMIGEATCAQVLSGRATAGRADPGAIVCACLNIGINQITAAICTQGALTVAALGAGLGAGSNCGSCRPELHALIAAHAPTLDARTPSLAAE